MNQPSRTGTQAGLHADISWANARLLGCLVGLALSLPAIAQTGSVPGAGASGKTATTKAATPAATSDPAWNTLSAKQKEALQPLAPIWGDIEANRKRKWIAMSANFASLSPADQRTLHGRMSEWATLTSAQRNRARLNFAQSRQLTNTEKKAQWEAYQALSPERKQELAAQAGASTRGAAPAVPRPSNRKLAAVPTTRSAPEVARPAGSDKTTAVPSDATASDAVSKP